MIKQLFVIVVLLWLNVIQAQNSPSNNVSSEPSEIETETMKFEQFNHSLIDYNKAVKSYNAFVNFRNKNFKPEKSDADIQKMIDNGLKMSASAQTKLSQIQKPEGQLNNQRLNIINDSYTIHRETRNGFGKTNTKHFGIVAKRLYDSVYCNVFQNPMEHKGLLTNIGDRITL